MRAYAFASVTLLSVSLASLVACGGGNAAAKPPGSANGEGAGPGAAGGDPSGGSSGASADAGPTTTTTTTLGNNGDLQGAKLETKSGTTSIEVKTDGGPKPDAKGEVGRRREDIQALVVAHRDEARKCYDDGLKSHPGIEGDLDVKWVIDPKGVVGDISVDDAKSTIHETSVGDCIVAIIKKIKFAESDKGFETRTHYPFNFHPHMAQQQPKSSGK